MNAYDRRRLGKMRSLLASIDKQLGFYAEENRDDTDRRWRAAFAANDAKRLAKLAALAEKRAFVRSEKQ